MEIIRFLRAEWLPAMPNSDTTRIPGETASNDPWSSDEISAMLKEWSEKTGFYDISTLGL
jgi:hypothetical protein